MKMVLVTAKFDKFTNGVREQRRQEVETFEEADKWLQQMDKEEIPAMFFVKGSFDTDFPQFCENKFYKQEYKKIQD